MGADEDGDVAGTDALASSCTVPSCARISIFAFEESRVARSAARSLATCSRALALLTLPPRVSFSDGSSRWTTRMRSGAATGASLRRGVWLASAALTLR